MALRLLFYTFNFFRISCGDVQREKIFTELAPDYKVDFIKQQTFTSSAKFLKFPPFEDPRPLLYHTIKYNKRYFKDNFICKIAQIKSMLIKRNLLQNVFQIQTPKQFICARANMHSAKIHKNHSICKSHTHCSPNIKGLYFIQC